MRQEREQQRSEMSAQYYKGRGRCSGFRGGRVCPGAKSGWPLRPHICLPAGSMYCRSPAIISFRGHMSQGRGHTSEGPWSHVTGAVAPCALHSTQLAETLYTKAKHERFECTRSALAYTFSTGTHSIYVSMRAQGPMKRI